MTKPLSIASVCSLIPAHGQPIGVAFFLHFGSSGTGGLAVVSTLGDQRTVVSLLRSELLGAFLWHALAVGGPLLAGELSLRGRLAAVSF